MYFTGPLLSITNLMMRNSSLEWEAPFTLNLTNAHPDIVYCVDVYNVSCAGRQHLVSDCSLTEPTYHYYPQTDIILEYVVVPRSNVQNARNGTPQVLTGTSKSSCLDIVIIIASISCHLQRNTCSSMHRHSHLLSLKVIIK